MYHGVAIKEVNMRNLETIHPKLLYNQICNRLKKQFGPLPPKGVIAGQAVASAIYEIMGLSKKGIYNDLDIFCDHCNYPKFRSDKDSAYLEKDDEPKSIDKRTLAKFSGSKGAAAMWVSSFSADVGHINQTGYAILDTDNDPHNLRHNYVKVSFRGYQNNIPADAIISSFDINCVQAAIDVEKGTVHWTENFKISCMEKRLR